MGNKQLCPVCNGESSFRTHKYGLLRCDACGLVVSPTVWLTDTNERMEELWFGEDYQRESSFWVEWFEAWNNRRTFSRLDAMNLVGKRLLEIGVGSGSFLNAAKARGYMVKGCDLSDSICRQVETSYGISMHSGLLETLKGEECFDIVVMNHVLEHVQRPIEFLQEVHRLLAPGGIVHIAVPNIDCWEARLPGWNSYEPYHLTYFNPALLDRVCRAAALLPIHIKTHESFSGWFLAIARSVLGVNLENTVVEQSAAVHTRITRRPTRLEHAYRLAMTLVGGGSWPLRFVQGRLGFGDEVICLAQKPAG